eukprot:g45.t1
MASKSGYQGDFEFTDSDEIVFIKNTIQRVKQKKLTTTQLIATLKELSSFLKLISQKDERVKSTAKPLCSELASEKYCYHTNKDVRYLTAFNMGQFFRIYSPHSPLETDQISVVFGLFLPFFEVLKSPSSDFRFSYALETLQKMAEVRFCLLLLTLDSMDLLLDLIRTLLRIVNDENYALVQESITEILTCILASYGKIPESLIKAVVHPILEEDQHPAAARLVGIVIDGVKMDRQIHSFCIGVISTWLPSSQGKPEYCQKVITKICKFFPMVASSILLHVKESLHDVNEQKRLKILEVVVKLLGNELQRLRTEEHKLLFHEFLERFVDIKVEIRATTVASVPEILKELNSESMGRELLNECLMRLLDPDERVRCKAIVASVNSLPLKINWVTRQTLVEIFLRLKDRKSVVRRCAVENILKLFHLLNEEWGELKNVMAESMGHLFETIVAFPELRSLFFIITSKSHFFPDQLDPDSNADLLVLPDEEVNGMMKDWTEIISAKMNETQFALEPFSAAAIQLVCTIGQLRPILLRPYSETLSEFVLSAYLQSEVGIPKALISNPSVPENVNLTLFLKCMALKAITKSVILLPRSTPASRTEFQPHSDKIQCIGDRILDLIQSQDFMSPSTDSTFMIPHQVTHFGSSDNYLRTTATEIALKLSRNRKSEISNILFKDIASMVLDQEEPVRLQVVRKISQHVNQLLQRGQIHRAQKYAACLTLSVIDPCDEIKSLAKEFLNSFISVQRRNASIIVQNQSPISVQTALPEFILSYLVYIIAHDDNFPNSELVASRGCGVFDYFQQMLLFGLEPLIKVEMKVPGENIPLMKKLMKSIKLAHDAEDPEFDTRIYATCDIALELLKEICNNGGEHWLKEWNKTFPGVILLPKALYRVEHHPSEPPRSFLPKDFRTISIEFFKKGKKRGRDREQHEGTGSDRRNLEDSTPRVSNTQLSVVKREKSQKQSKTPMTNKTRTRTTKRQRKEPKSKRN